MIDYFVVDLTGRVTMTGRVPDKAIELQHCEGFRVGLAKVGDYVNDQGELQSLPVKPSDLHTFDYQAKAYVLDVAKVRAKRDSLLAQSDWTQLPDVPLETKKTWAIYRQALRDVTEQAGFPIDVAWPLSP